MIHVSLWHSSFFKPLCYTGDNVFIMPRGLQCASSQMTQPAQSAQECCFLSYQVSLTLSDHHILGFVFLCFFPGYWRLYQQQFSTLEMNSSITGFDQSGYHCVINPVSRMDKARNN